MCFQNSYTVSLSDGYLTVAMDDDRGSDSVTLDSNLELGQWYSLMVQRLFHCHLNTLSV